MSVFPSATEPIMILSLANKQTNKQNENTPKNNNLNQLSCLREQPQLRAVQD